MTAVQPGLAHDYEGTDEIHTLIMVRSITGIAASVSDAS